MKLLRTDRAGWTLRRRLLAFLLLPLAVVLALSLLADFHIASEPAQEAYDHALSDDAVALSERVKWTEARGLEVDLPVAAEEVLRNDSIDQEMLAVYSPNGRLLIGDADLLPDQTVVGHAPRLSDATLRGKKIRKASYALKTPQGVVTVAVAETTHKRARTTSKILAAMIFPNIVLILLTLALVYIGIRSGLAPLNHLSEEIQRRSPHDLSPLPKGDVPGEALPLVNAMAALIDDLRLAATAQKAFLANAAHQLKTPLAGLQTQLELAAQEMAPEHRQRVEHLRDSTERLAHLTHQLLALARSGPEAEISQEKRPIDLSRMLLDQASLWYDRALARNIDLGFEAGEAATEGVEWLLRELLANLVDNALCYTPPGGRVTVRSGVDAGRSYLEVEDDGPGVPPEERERIFERFYRPVGAPGAGTGLGLSIVKEVAERHAAEIQLVVGAEGGSRFRVTFLPG